MFPASDRTIGRAVDSCISQNPIGHLSSKYYAGRSQERTLTQLARLSVWFSAKGASVTASLGQRPGFLVPKHTSAESAVHFAAPDRCIRTVRCAFSACYVRSKILGHCPRLPMRTRL